MKPCSRSSSTAIDSITYLLVASWMRRRIDWTSSKNSVGVHLIVAGEEDVGEDVFVALSSS